MDKTKETISIYRDSIKSIFSVFLKQYGFIKTLQKTEEYYFSIIYQNETRYIKFGSTLHPHDYPYYFYLSLGEGSTEFPESDWNAIPLWKYFENELNDNYKNLYSIEYEKDKIIKQIETNLDLLKKYGLEFLNNKLEDFKMIRSEMNKKREPYKIYTPKNGKLVMNYDDKSLDLKKRFS